MRYYVIAWRGVGCHALFFRGDNRYKIYLPFISETQVSWGWVETVERARLFDTFPVFDRTSFSKNFNAERLCIYPYDEEPLPSQLLRPTKRPERWS